MLFYASARTTTLDAHKLVGVRSNRVRLRRVGSPKVRPATQTIFWVVLNRPGSCASALTADETCKELSAFEMDYGVL
jgi:hypothetical protein